MGTASVMDSLPEDLVVRILAMVGDGLMLLDVLPLVCKRWARLCRDPEAWSEVDLEWDGDQGDSDESSDSDSDASSDYAPMSDADAMRLLLRAPALRTIRLDWDFGEGGLAKIMGAFRRSRVIVKEALHVAQEVWTDTCHASRVALLDAMWRSRATLKAVSLSLYLEEDLDSEVDSSDEEDEGTKTTATHTGPLVDSQGHTALQVLASLQHLDWLDVDSSSDYPYAGELKGGLPNLRYLTVNEASFAEGVLPEPLLLDLIRGTNKLRSLDLGSDYGRPASPFLEMVGADHDFRDSVTPALLECISKCADLHLLSGPDEVAALLGGMPLLEFLVVNVHPRAEGEDVAARVSAVLGHCSAAATPLKNVQIFVDDVFSGRDDDAARTLWLKQQRDKCEAHVKEFESNRPDTAVAFHWE